LDAIVPPRAGARLPRSRHPSDAPFRLRSSRRMRTRPTWQPVLCSP